jgi:hypothetical protein
MTASTASAVPVLPDDAASTRSPPGLGVGLPQDVDGLGVGGRQPEVGPPDPPRLPGEWAEVVPERVDAVLRQISLG